MLLKSRRVTARQYFSYVTPSTAKVFEHKCKLKTLIETLLQDLWRHNLEFVSLLAPVTAFIAIKSIKYFINIASIKTNKTKTNTTNNRK